jgi:hypothetical protein
MTTPPPRDLRKWSSMPSAAVPDDTSTRILDAWPRSQIGSTTASQSFFSPMHMTNAEPFADWNFLGPTQVVGCRFRRGFDRRIASREARRGLIDGLHYK